MNESGIYPFTEKVLVKLDPVAEMSAGGIALPKELTDKEYMAQTRATVVAFGEHVSLNIDEGDRVIIGKFTGLIQEGNDGVKYRILLEYNILAKVVADE